MPKDSVIKKVDLTALAEGLAKASRAKKSGEGTAAPTPSPKKVEDPIKEDPKPKDTPDTVNKKKEPFSIPGRDDKLEVIVKSKKSSVPTESVSELEEGIDEEEPKTTTASEEDEPEEASEIESSEDSEDEEDQDDEVLKGKDNESENFKNLRKSRNKYFKRAKELEKQLKEVAPLIEKGKALSVALSPEFEAAHAGARAEMITKAENLAEVYGYNKDFVKQAFEQKTIKEAKDILEDNVDDPRAVSELGQLVRDFFLNKNDEKKILEEKDPEAVLANLKKRKEEIEARQYAERMEAINLAKTKTADELKSILSNPREAKQLWGAAYSEDISKYIETDLAEALETQALTNYEKWHEFLGKNGAELSFEASRSLATTITDATFGLMANKVIPILLNRLSELEEEYNKQIGYSNPSVKQTTKVRNPPKDSEPKGIKEKTLDMVKRIPKG